MLTLLPIGIVIVLAFVVLKFVSTGALIDGVKRARSNGSLTLRDGFREGWAHWGVLLRIAPLARSTAYTRCPNVSATNNQPANT